MNVFYKYLVVIFFIFNLLSCSKEKNSTEKLKSLYLAGNFESAIEMIEKIKSTSDSGVQLHEIEVIEAKIERTMLDFSKTETQIIDELKPWFPDISTEQLRSWENGNKLEMKMINGERRYFKNAVANLFRLDSTAKEIREKAGIATTDPLKIFCLQHTSEILETERSTQNISKEPKKFRIDFTITLNPDVVPPGETIKCWMPFPRESLPRQKNVKLLSVNSKSFELAGNDILQRSLYIEKTTEAEKPTIFSYSAEFESIAHYISPEFFKIEPYDINSGRYKTYTSERKPHIIFTEQIKQLTNEVTLDASNPYEKVKAIYYWIDNNITWASALEYSTFECIPEYVLQNRHGDCGMQTLLFMSMARYAGIPCKWQSGWMLHPGELNLHDWCEVYYEGVGWVPLDQSFGLQNSENIQIKEFYITGIDEFRMIINDDFSNELFPKKQFYRSEPIDFQRGELEWRGGNIYFNKWDYHLDITYLN